MPPHPAVILRAPVHQPSIGKRLIVYRSAALHPCDSVGSARLPNRKTLAGLRPFRTATRFQNLARGRAAHPGYHHHPHEPTLKALHTFHERVVARYAQRGLS